MSKKIAILIQKGFSNKFEPQALQAAFTKAGWLADIITIEDVYAVYNDEGDFFAHKTHGDLAKYDVLLVREVFAYFKYALNIISYLKKHGKVVVDNNLASEKMMINKLIDGQRIVQAGLPFPKTYHAHTLENYLAMIPRIDKEVGFPVVIKHRSSGKGAKIYKLEDRLDLENTLTDLQEENKLGRFYIQEYLPLAADYRVLVVADQVVGAMLRIPKKGDFRANFSLGGTVEPAELTDEMKDLATRAAQATNANFGGVDIVYTTDKKPYLLEVNRTPGFEGFTKAHGIDVAKMFVDYVTQKVA
ncbi:MAG: RimK family alpha-L-glutamate ligase [Candidatus Dojkabacteria bacterium]|nr:MAG: RimK family alpha-L-glutamate ligase [Candidatus Dojkabacteria bacterium]